MKEKFSKSISIFKYHIHLTLWDHGDEEQKPGGSLIKVQLTIWKHRKSVK